MENKIKKSLKETATQLGYLKEEIEVQLDDLTMDVIKKHFIDNYKNVHFTRTQPNGEEGPYYRDAISFPEGDDKSSQIGDMGALEDYKEKMRSRYGDVAVVLKPEAKNWFDKVFINNEKFNQANDKFIRGKQAWADKEMAAGRSID